MLGRSGTVLVVLLTVLAVGCGYIGGSKREKFVKKQAAKALKEGRYGSALAMTDQLLTLNPKNFAAKRMRSKIKDALMKQAEAGFKKGAILQAATNAELVLKIDPKNKRALYVHRESKKKLLIRDAKKALEEDNIADAVHNAEEAIKLDPNFAAAKEVIEEVNAAREEEIAELTVVFDIHLKAKDFRKALAAAEQIKDLRSQDPEAEKRVKQIKRLILAESKQRNLALAELYFREQRYESALTKVEEVLKIDPKNRQAIELRDRATAELEKPEVILTGIARFPGGLVAAFEIPELNEETYIKHVEDSFEGFAVIDISEQDKTVVLEYEKTKSRTVLNILR